MKYLGIDYGKKKIGLAIADSESKLAQPLRILRYEDIKKALKQVGQVVNVERVDQVVIGISEGRMAKETRRFAKDFKEELGLPVFFQDETLTTQDAQNLSFEAGIKKKKRKSMEDAYSAALILQNFLDSGKRG